MPMPYFDILKKDSTSAARTGIIHTAHGDIQTPAFLPIGTKGAVKSVTAEELKFWGAEIVLANTYHLWQRPGDTLIYKAGGLHQFMNWKGPIFTDSGGFQVFSLAKMRKVMEVGVTFQFDMDGRTEILSPEKSVDIQANLGSDIALILDDFPGYPFEHERSKQSIDLTKRWAERAIKEYRKIIIDGDPINPGQKLWGIVQGASFPDLREQSAKDMVSLGFEAFAIGGVAVGEPHKEMMKAVSYAIPHLPETSPKHLLGVGTPFDIVQAASLGCDTFDCVIPTREARHGKLYISNGDGYSTINIDNEKFKEDFTTIDNTCDCYLCLNHTKSYLRHLFASGEPLAIRLATMHNLKFYLNLMAKIRNAIQYEHFNEMLKSYKEVVTK
ncbi:MAG TPA: tRNA guanosine(34) transglycosylase Tgt [Candidatus Limnocylindria bacterium]|nr:tRNA guanosine(34) transglycosylase Tgt [Candidatus Limnocylindria bacterium]